MDAATACLPFGISIVESQLMMPGFHALKRRGELVWVGPLGAPIEDADCDTIILHPDDAARFGSAALAKGDER